MFSKVTMASMFLSAGLMVGLTACADRTDPVVTPAQNRTPGSSGRASDVADPMDRRGGTDVDKIKTNEDSRTMPGTATPNTP